MKRLKLMLGAGMLLLLGVPAIAQVQLPEIKIVATRYKYLTAVDNKEVAQPVKMLQNMVATYDVTKADFYEDDYDNYFVSFYIPDGEVLAAYDGKGNLLRTAEKYKNIKLPSPVAKAIHDKYPQYSLAKDVYLVNYYGSPSDAKKLYKVSLQNGNQRKNIKISEDGEFK